MQCSTLTKVLTFLVITTIGCVNHPYDVTAKVPNEMKTIIFNSYDPYGPLTRSIRDELHVHNFILLHNDSRHNNVALPILHLMNSYEDQTTVSIFQDGKKAEYKMVLRVEAKVSILDNNDCPINVEVHRYLLNNPFTVLAQHTEEEFIRQELFEQAAKQVVREFLMMIEKQYWDRIKISKSAMNEIMSK